MSAEFSSNRKVQLALGLGMGILFGFFLQKGQVTQYEVIIGQLLLKDFTVAKVILSAIVTGMIGLYALRHYDLIELHPKPGAVGSTVIGSLIFGVGFALLGYCPGTAAGAVGQGSLDALIGGVFGILAGCHLYALMFPWLDKHILQRGSFGEVTLHELLKLHPLKTVAIAATALILMLLVLEIAGY